jgi:hypothetical protein
MHVHNLLKFVHLMSYRLQTLLSQSTCSLHLRFIGSGLGTSGGAHDLKAFNEDNE